MFLLGPPFPESQFLGTTDSCQIRRVGASRGQDCSKLNICKYLVICVRVSPSSDQSSCVEWSGPGPAIRSVTKLKTDRAIPTGQILHFSQKTISLPLRIEMIDDNLIAGSRHSDDWCSAHK